jgi:hypothetical protein
MTLFRTGWREGFHPRRESRSLHNPRSELHPLFFAEQFSRCRYHSTLNISNNSSFHLEHPCVPDGSDCSGGTLYPLTENQTQPVAQMMGRVAYLPCVVYYTKPLIIMTRRVVYYAHRSCVRLPLLCIRNVVMHVHHPNNTYVTLFAGVAVMQ